jgi:hypothetical protein
MNGNRLADEPAKCPWTEVIKNAPKVAEGAKNLSAKGTGVELIFGQDRCDQP